MNDQNPNYSGNHLDNIEKELISINKRLGGSLYGFWRGMVSGAGYVVGGAVIIFVIGIILNVIGVIPAFQNQVAEFRQLLQDTRPSR